MNALFSRFSASFRRPALTKPVPALEPVRPASRPMTGFLATLSADQREKALGYQGSDTHG